MNKTNGAQLETTGRKPIQKAIKAATVIASLGASLGVNISALLASDLSATDPCGDLTQIQLSQGELMSQVKRLTEEQNRLLLQLKAYAASGRIVPLSQVTAIRSTSNNLASQIKSSNEQDAKLKQRLVTDKTAINSKVAGIESRESILVNQLKMFQANQATLYNLLDNLKVDQTK